MHICAASTEGVHCKASDTAFMMAWLAWLFPNLEHDLEWPLSALKDIVQHAETCIGTMMRSGRYFTHSEWVETVSSGHLLVKQWVRLAKQGVDMSLPFLAKVRPKVHALQRMVQFLELSESLENPGYYSCWMDEDRALHSKPVA